MNIISAVVVFKYLLPVLANLNSVDLNRCKLTHPGTEYTGKLSKTITNATCQYWNSTGQKGSDSMEDEVFPDGSKALANNYCRNPNRNPKGPWCFIAQEKQSYELCDVPLCKSSECRVSGSGIEYAGSIEESSSGKRCMKWKKSYILGRKLKAAAFKNRFFPDGSVEKAGQKCRNPDGDLAGPWCYVETGGCCRYAKELCDIPFCDSSDLVMYSEGSVSGKYFFFSSINESQSLNVSFRLWNPAAWLRGEWFVFLSAYDIAVDRKDIERWNSGIEIKIERTGIGIVSREAQSVNKTPITLSGALWTDVEITWTKPENGTLLVQVYKKPERRLAAISKIPTLNSVFQVESFRYYSLGGSGALWNFPSQYKNCPVHTVSQLNFTRFWLIRKTKPLGKEIEIFLRAKAEAVIVLRMAPMNKIDQIELIIGDKIRINAYYNESQSRQLAESTWTKALDLWKWEHFKIVIFKDKLQFFWTRHSINQLLIEVTHQNVEKVMWVTFASSRVSYWTLYCDPGGVADPPRGALHESNIYNGTLSVSQSGRQCIPWTDNVSIPEEYCDDSLFEPYGGKVSCQNFCRNLNKDPNGAYCIVRDATIKSGFKMEYCHPRSYSLGDCASDDYIEKRNVTRSKRGWANFENAAMKMKNFSGTSLEDLSRNATKNLIGSWCSAKDRKAWRDFCFVRECDKPMECTCLTGGFTEGTRSYILPAWRKNGLQFWLKAWNADIYEGFILSFASKDLSQEYKLYIGADEGEKVKLFCSNETSDALLIKKTLPHLLPIGTWRGYWLKPNFEKIELGYYGETRPFFEWTNEVFEPVFLNFGTIKNHWVGISFKCSECLAMQTSTKDGFKIFPINLWRDESITTNLLLNLRGTGSAYVNLMFTEDFNVLFAVQIMSNMSDIFILRYERNQPHVIGIFAVGSAMSDCEWSEYIFGFADDNLIIYKDGAHILEWKSPFALQFYWFSVTAEEGSVTWTANCPPSDIDGNPRDGNWGKWGPWTCSVTCGKGHGRIERVCNDPPPNVFGKECKGQPVYEGPCNDFPCGKISPATYNIIRHYLSSQFKSLQVDAFERVVLMCNSKAISLISQEVSEMNVTWTHNGFPYSRTKFHMDDNYSLIIHRAQEKHNGIYLCIAYQDPDSIPSKVVLEVISLVVIKPKPKKIRKGKSLTLKCNGLALSYVYADLSQRWELNGTIWKDYGLGTLETFTVDKLENVTDSHAGVWTCVIIQEDFKFKWTTNWVYLKVKSAPSFWSVVMEDIMVMVPILGKLRDERSTMILFFFFLGTAVGFLVLLIIILLNSLHNSKCRKKKKQVNPLQKG